MKTKLTIDNAGSDAYTSMKYVLHCFACNKPIWGSDKEPTDQIKRICAATPCSRCLPPAVDLEGMSVMMDQPTGFTKE